MGGRIKRLKEDEACSLLVRECFDWECSSPRLTSNCIISTNDSDPGRGRFHASHWISRKEYATRFLPQNQTCSCMYCHNHMETRKHLVEAEVRKYYGDDDIDFVVRLDRLYSQIGSQMFRDKPFAKGDAWRERIYKWLRERYKEVRQMRMDGEVGFINPGLGPFKDLVDFYDKQTEITL